MKSIKIILTFFFCGVLTLDAQEIFIQKFIGKNISEAVKNYGKPTYQDKTDSEMIMTFYKTPDKDYTFVSGSEGVYQANATIRYSGKQSATSALNKFLQECQSTGFVIDTLGTENYELRQPKVDVKISSSPGLEKRYNILIEATKREE